MTIELRSPHPIALTNLSTRPIISLVDFGRVIKLKRGQLGMSLREVAAGIEVDPAYLSRVEGGKVRPSDFLVNRLSEILGYDKNELFLLAGRLPEVIRTMIEQDPNQAASILRTIRSALDVKSAKPARVFLPVPKGERAIEDGFPFEQISDIAEIESWRKELYRPIYHLHKWWAQRLGSVFRAAVIGAATPKGSPVSDLFYKPICIPELVIFDPFMGSGTTVGEAHKLGCSVIGRDINPVAYRSVKVALGPLNQAEISAGFQRLENTIGRKIHELYQSYDGDGNPCEVLYYFWVKILPCPSCGKQTDLYSTYIFARHAYGKSRPGVQIVCPQCSAIFPGTLGKKMVSCRECGCHFNPEEGPAKRATAICTHCRQEFQIAKVARGLGHPPEHRMYAKLVLRSDGRKEYLRITPEDIAAFDKARRQLAKLHPPLPRVRIEDGYNTRQILNYGYRSWHELFNERQLLALTLLAQAIRDLPSGNARDALALLFSGVLEFNNMFASYKGEGTGAVRHMFSHHILKPERMPIEANVWGTPKSSGAFSTLYYSRLIRALDYRQAPFEVAVEYEGRIKKGRKVYDLSPQMGTELVASYPKPGLKPGMVYLSCGDSADTDIPDRSVDLVMTDPPFFDNVHYSQLADFFYVWQQLYFADGTQAKTCTTRRKEEVQDTDAESFSKKLGRVFMECDRVLKEDGLLVFSYHHSREDGWRSVAKAVLEAGFAFAQSQPVKSEMSVAAPKNQAKSPIDLDVLLVCKKVGRDQRQRQGSPEALTEAERIAKAKIARFNKVGRRLSENDVRVVLLSQLLVELSPGRKASEMETALAKLMPSAQDKSESLWRKQEVIVKAFEKKSPLSHEIQSDLFSSLEERSGG